MEESFKTPEKEGMYRSEIFKLLINSIEVFDEKDIQILRDLFISDELNNDDLLSEIIE